MEDLALLIAQINTGQSEAYEPIVRAFQNMAVGYGYAILGDFQLAEDAAQEAFIAAYFELPTLREPKAFPGWFRRILMKQINRARRTRRSNLMLDDQLDIASYQQMPIEVIESRESQASIMAAIRCLPAAQREVVPLFYMDEYAHHDISAFLDIPVSTVKMRLYHARKSLQQHLTLIQDNLRRQRPSRNNDFTEKIMSYEVQTKQIPAMKVISISRRVFHKELQSHLDNSINAMIVVAEASGIRIAGLPMSIYYGSVSENVDAEVEVCLPIEGTLPERADMKVRDLPATEAACVKLTIRQSIFPGITKAYDALREWMTTHNHNPGTPPREVYLNFNRSIFSPIASLDDSCVDIE